MEKVVKIFILIFIPTLCAGQEEIFLFSNDIELTKNSLLIDDSTARRCFSCSNCIVPVNASLVDCYSSCYIGIESNGQIVRGCESSFNNTKSCSKDDSLINSCYTCNDDYCNAILYPQVGRRQCYDCTGNNCAISEDSVNYCAKYGESEKCLTVFSLSEDVVIRRGCLSEIETQQVCTSDNSNCLQCSYDKCNKDDSKLKTFTCIGCDSTENHECLVGNSILEKRCSTNQCYSRIFDSILNVKAVERGCLADINGTCGSSEICTTCSGTNCNNLLFPSSRITCNYCTGRSCLNGDISVKTCNSYIENEACISVYDDAGLIYKDCYADTAIETQKICDDSTDFSCTKCTTANCNSDTSRRGTKCFKCNGFDCFNPVFPTDVVDCSHEGCYVGINSNGETHRDCATAVNTSQCAQSDTENQSCLVCNEDFCNYITYPVQNRLICKHCLRENCEINILEDEYCEILSQNEKCASLFDSNNQTLERGCLSTLENTAMCSGNNCLTCDFNGCNVHMTLEENYYCISCDSSNDPRCTSANTDLLSLTKTCSSNQCYSRLVDVTNSTWKYIEKGCVADLTTTGLTCTSETSCNSCTGSLCNNILYPSNQLSCNTCQNEECQQPTLETQYCGLYNQQSGSCVTFYNDDNQVVLRGCYSNVPLNTQNICDDSTDLRCTKCTTSNCNTDTARRGNKCFKCNGIDCFNPVYPTDVFDCSAGGCYVGINSNGETIRDCASAMDTTQCTQNETAINSCLVCNEDFCNGITYPLNNHLTCKQCLRENCELDLLEDNYCEIVNTDERCVSIFDSDGTILERGCSSSVQNKAQCDANSANCLKCDFNGCNMHGSIDETNFCTSCDSLTDPSCVNVNGLIKTCSTDQCYSRLVDVANSTWKYIEKGCVADLTSTCTSETSCSSCTGSLCNNILYPSNQLSCNTCENEECQQPTLETNYCGLYNQQSGSCVTFYNDDDQVVLRGCYSNVPLITQNICDDSTDLHCTKCTTANCNNDTARRGNKCFKCNGIDCFNPVFPTDVVGCSQGGCYIGINSNGETVRDCASAVNSSLCAQNDTEINSCLVCNDDYCNAITYPLNNRLQCHVCVGNCAGEESNLNYCERLHADEHCVSVLDSNKKSVERGCSSSLVYKDFCTGTNNCIFCTGSGCNKPRSCISCDSSINSNCVHNPTLMPSSSCDMDCYTRISNGDLIRGCSQELHDITCSNATNCKSCSNTDNCNSDNYPDERMTCLTCTSSTDCQNPQVKSCVKYTPNDKCVTIFDSYSVSQKGCLADQSSSIQNQCNLNNITCSQCTTKACNTDTVRKDEKCIACNSAIDSRCAQNPSNLTASSCLVTSNGQCFTRISNEATIRDCRGRLSTTEANSCNNALCGISTGQGSNSEIFPATRTKCFECDSNNDNLCHAEQTAESNTILPCKRYRLVENLEYCVKITYSSGRVVRGCLADFSNSTCSEANCESCIGEGCNKNFGFKISFNIMLLILTFFIIKNNIY